MIFMLILLSPNKANNRRINVSRISVLFFLFLMVLMMCIVRVLVLVLKEISVIFCDLSLCAYVGIK